MDDELGLDDVINGLKRQNLDDPPRAKLLRKDDKVDHVEPTTSATMPATMPATTPHDDCAAHVLLREEIQILKEKKDMYEGMALRYLRNFVNTRKTVEKLNYMINMEKHEIELRLEERNKREGIGPSKRTK